MIEDDARNMTYQDYTATMLKALSESFIRFAGGDWSPPSFISMVYRQERDDRTPEQIIDHVKSLFDREGET